MSLRSPFVAKAPSKLACRGGFPKSFLGLSIVFVASVYSAGLPCSILDDDVGDEWPYSVSVCGSKMETIFSFAGTVSPRRRGARFVTELDSPEDATGR